MATRAFLTSNSMELLLCLLVLAFLAKTPSPVENGILEQKAQGLLVDHFVGTQFYFLLLADWSLSGGH